MAARLRRHQAPMLSSKPGGRHRRPLQDLPSVGEEPVNLLDPTVDVQPIPVVSPEILSDPISAILSPLAQIGVVRNAVYYLLDRNLTITGVSGNWQQAAPA